KTVSSSRGARTEQSASRCVGERDDFAGSDSGPTAASREHGHSVRHGNPRIRTETANRIAGACVLDKSGRPEQTRTTGCRSNPGPEHALSSQFVASAEPLRPEAQRELGCKKGASRERRRGRAELGWTHDIAGGEPGPSTQPVRHKSRPISLQGSSLIRKL